MTDPLRVYHLAANHEPLPLGEILECRRKLQLGHQRSTRFHRQCCVVAMGRRAMALRSPRYPLVEYAVLFDTPFGLMLTHTQKQFQRALVAAVTEG